MLGIIDVNTGNLGSLYSALNKLGFKYKICKNIFDFEKVEKNYITRCWCIWRSNE